MFILKAANYTFKYPDEDVAEEKINYIKNFIDIFEISIDEGLYDNYIDVNSWARWLIAHDILGTWDACGSNMYITKYDNTNYTKLMMGNLWDFDSNYINSENFASTHFTPSYYFYKLLSNSNTLFKDT